MIRDTPQNRKKAVELSWGGDYAMLEKLCKEILKRDKQCPFATANLGVIYARRGNFRKAIELYTQGLQKNPKNVPLNVNISRSLQELRDHASAYKYAKIATEIEPSNMSAWLNLSFSAMMIQKIDEAVEAGMKAVELEPNNAKCWNNLGTALHQAGKVSDAIEAYKNVIRLDPHNESGYMNILMSALYDEHSRLVDSLEICRKFEEVFEKPFVSQWDSFNYIPREPHRKLKIGFASPDFTDHAVMYFFEPLLARLDREQFEIVCFFMYPEGSDDHITKKVKIYADEFVYLGGKQADEQAGIIKSKNIDILIDLAGHTARTALVAMARKPAPIQMTWLGYPGTTGLKAVDYRITDMVADCEVEGEIRLKEQYSEKLIVLPPPFCVYRPSIRMPISRYMPHYQVRTTPALQNGFITFGSCNNIAKLTAKTLGCWSRILNIVDGSKLLVEGKGFDSDNVREEFLVRCELYGISRDKLILKTRESKNQYLTYHEIDIALDPFPLTGGTTTFDTLWMGVPLVTMSGSSFRSRMGVSILTAFGEKEWIANSEDEYVSIACKLASDISGLNQKRVAQRTKMINSPLMNEGAFASYFGDLLRKAWYFRCADGDISKVNSFLSSKPSSVGSEPIVFLESERLKWSEAMKKLGEKLNISLQQSLQSDEAQTVLKDEWRETRDLALAMLGTIPFAAAPLYAMALLEENHANYYPAIGYMSWVCDAEQKNIIAYKKIIEWYGKLGNTVGVEQIRSVAASRGVTV